MRIRKYNTVIFLFVIILITGCSKTGSSLSDLAIPEIKELTLYAHKIKVGWTSIAKAQKYEVGYGLDKKFRNEKILTTSNTTLDIDGLEADQQYYLRIRAYDGTHWTHWSESTKAVKTAAFSTTVETYNVLRDSAYYLIMGLDYYNQHNIDGKDFWANRRLVFKELILSSDNLPDILALQEVYAQHQLNDIASSLDTAYAIHKNVHGEVDAGAILWKKDKYVLVDAYDDILGYHSVTVTASNHYITAVRLKEKASGKELLVFDVHPSSGATATKQRVRGESARRIADTAKIMSKKYHIPAIIMGDFNNTPTSVIQGYPGGPMVLKSLGFLDAFEGTKNRLNPDYYSWFDIYEMKAQKGTNSSRIDMIFVYPKEQVTVSDYEMLIRFQEEAEPFYKLPLPSDHHPVKATLHLFY